MTPCPPAAAAAALLLGALAALAAAPPAAARGGATPAPAKPAAASGAVSGQVKDETGAPVAGAEVLVAPTAGKGSWKATSDAKGAFTVRGLPAGEATVVVRARTRIPVEQKVAVAAGGVARADAVLRLGVRFAGTVTDLRGAPVAGAVVEPSRAGGDGSGDAAAALGARRTGPDGAFDLDGLVPGVPYDVHVRHPRFVELPIEGLVGEPGGGHAAIEAVLEDAAWVKGVVVGPDGKPLPSARVSLRGESALRDVPEWIRRFLIDAGVTTFGPGPAGDAVDAQGRFELGSLDEDEVEVAAIADGYFETRSRITGLVPGQAKEDVRIALEPATAWVEGVVVDADGKPVAAAKIVANGDHGRAGEATSDAQGRFRLTHVRSRAPVSLRASAKGRADARVNGVALNAGGVSLTLHVAPRLRAKVLGADGKPLAQVSLRISLRLERGGETEHATVEQGAGGLDVELPLGDVEVAASGPDGARAHLGEWRTEAGEVVDAGTVTLKPRPARAPESDDEDE